MRKGGNPDLVEHQYKCLIDDKPMEVLSIRIAQGTKEKLIQKFGKNYADKIRELIANHLLDEQI
jgi:hypothetical protein